MKRLIAAFAVLALVIAACANPPVEQSAPAEEEITPAGDLTHVQLYLSFIPNVQFAPFYVAIEEDYFEDNSIEVELEHMSETDALKLTAADDELSAAVVSGEQVLLARSQEIPVKYVYEWYQRWPVAIAAKSDAGLASFSDLSGMTVGVPVLEGASYIGLEAALFSAGLTDEDINIEVTNFAQVEALATDRAEAVVVYVANEPIQLEAQGIDIDVLSISDEADLVSNGLVVSERMIEENPAIVRSLTTALDGALRYTIDNPDEAFEISKRYVEGLDENPETEAAQREVLARSIELWEAERLGETDDASWETMQGVLLDMGLLDAPLDDLSEAYTNEYLP